MTNKILLILMCAFVIYLANTGRYFGVFINRYFPCTQNPENSFPCYGWIDLGIIVIALLAATYAMVGLMVQLFKSSAN